MATKLKNMKLTSVDLVRAGANQEADICLFKSADAAEPQKGPTEGEKNILKRFLAWLTETDTEDEYEPQEPVVEKSADEEDDYYEDATDIYKSAIIESLQSIAADETLSTDEKNAMIAKSIGQYHETMLDLVYAGEGVEKADEEEEEYEFEEDPDDESEIEEIDEV